MHHRNQLHVKSLEVLHQEVVEAAQIMKHQLDSTPLTFAYPFCKKTPEGEKLVMAHHSLGRLYHPIFEGSNPKAARGANARVEKALQDGSWVVHLTHAIEAPVLGAHLRFLEEFKDPIWVGTFAEVGRYEKTRRHCAVERLESTNKAHSFILRLDEAFKDPHGPVPLTVIVPPSWKGGLLMSEKGETHLSFPQGRADLWPGVVYTWKTP